MDEQPQVSKRSIGATITDLETMELVETWIQSNGSEGRVKKTATTFDPEWGQETLDQYIEQTPNVMNRAP